MDVADSLFCSNLVNRYYECIRINITVFGKERGCVMCDHIKNYMENSVCEKNNDEINGFINKIADEVEKNK